MPYNLSLFYYSSPVIIHSSQMKYIFFHDIVFQIERICLYSMLNFIKVEYKFYNITKLRSLNLHSFL